jgi:hypothetical protein
MLKMARVSVVDLLPARLRMQCQCGATLSILPAALEPGVFFCANCLKPWPA